MESLMDWLILHSFICGRRGSCCYLLCQQLIKEVLRIHYGNEALIVNLCKSHARCTRRVPTSSSIQPHINAACI